MRRNCEGTRARTIKSSMKPWMATVRRSGSVGKKAAAWPSSASATRTLAILSTAAGGKFAFARRSHDCLSCCTKRYGVVSSRGGAAGGPELQRGALMCLVAGS